MSQRARELRDAFENDEELRSRLQATPTPDDRRRIIADAGFGDVSLEDFEKTTTKEGS